MVIGELVDEIENVLLVDIYNLPGVKLFGCLGIVGEDSLDPIAAPARDFDPHPFVVATGCSEGRFQQDGFTGS